MAGNRSEKRYWKGMILAGAVLAVTVVLLLSVFGVFRVREVTITGNEYYTKEQVADFIVGEGLRMEYTVSLHSLQLHGTSGDPVY